jgi:hypothetical protein
MLTILKDQGVEVIDKIYGKMLQKMGEVKVPESDTSDIEKNNIKIFNLMFKVLHTASEINCMYLVSPANVAVFPGFLQGLSMHLERSVDKAVKKTIANILKTLFFHFSGLSSQPLTFSLFSKRASGSTSPTSTNSSSDQ